MTGPTFRATFGGLASAVVASALIVGLSAFVASTAGPASGTIAQDDGGDQTPPPDAGRIIGSPDAGPDPAQSGDRGGWAQLVTLGALAAGVGFIMWRIVHAFRDARPRPETE